MALNNNTQAQSNNKQVVLRLDGKADTPSFKILERMEEGGRFEDTGERTTSIKGVLKRIEFKEGEYNGDKTYQLSVHIEDSQAGEFYFVNINAASAMGRTFCNILSSLTEINNQEIELFVYLNKAGYKSAGVRVNWDSLSFKTSFKDLPAPEETTFAGKTLRDYTNLNNALFAQIKEVASLTNKNEGVPEGLSVEDVPFN